MNQVQKFSLCRGLETDNRDLNETDVQVFNPNGGYVTVAVEIPFALDLVENALENAGFESRDDAGLIIDAIKILRYVLEGPSSS